MSTVVKLFRQTAPDEDRRHDESGRSDRFHHTVRGIVLAVLVGVVTAAGCINASTPFAPQCTAAIGIEITAETIGPGDTFVATATHRGDECLTNLMWSASGVVTFRSAEGSSATFKAEQSGTGSIRVLNDKGSLGILEVEVDEGETSVSVR